MTLNQRLVFRSDFMRPDLVPLSRKSKEAYKSQILYGTRKGIDTGVHSCVYPLRVCVSTSSGGVFVNTKRKLERLKNPCSVLTLGEGCHCVDQ